MKHLLWLPAIVWLITTGITPVGGWNPNTPDYHPYYKLIFGVSGILTIISAAIGLIIMERDNNKHFKKREQEFRNR